MAKAQTVKVDNLKQRVTGLEWVTAGELAAHPGNWRDHPATQAAAMAGVLREVGIADALLAYRSARNDGKLTLIDGHLRRDLATAEKWPVLVLDVDDAEADYILATHDPLAAMAQADKAALDALLSTINSGEAAVQQMLADEAAKAGLYLDREAAGDDPGAQVDKAEELRVKWGVESGQLWTLGAHRLICGDCTDAAVVARVMEGEKAALAVTSPPYGVGKEYEKKGLQPWMELMRGCIPLIVETAEVCVWNIADMFCTGNQTMEHTFGYSWQIFGEFGFSLIWLRIWKKPGLVMDTAPYWSVTYKPGDQYEFIGAFAKPTLRFKQHITDAERKEWGMYGVWELSSVHDNDVHAAMFPVELPERAIKMHTDSGGIVYEPFSGSGTTIIACEKLSRKCRAVEISAGYVGVALERFYKTTGKLPVLLERA